MELNKNIKQELEETLIIENKYLKESRINKKNKHINQIKKINNLTPKTVDNISNKFKKKSIKKVKPNLVQPNIIKPKFKNQLQIMFSNLCKVMKQEGFFIETNKNYDNIIVLKDYNVQINGFKNHKHQLSVRAEIGIWNEFKQLVSLKPNDFSNIKQEFLKWVQPIINKYNINTEVQKTYNEFFSLENIDKRVLNFFPKLDNQLIQSWKKPNKQPHGFIHKGKQIFYLWLQEYQEVQYIEQIETELNLKSYEQTFPLARALNRKFSIFIGPTNSGKTYQALNELAKGETGTYLAPLRLMAAEGQEALFERGVITNLITGEEQQLIENATHTSSTVEMCNLNKIIDVAVIDEIQMISDPFRGWAWSQALIGVSARHVILVGSEESLPFIIPVIEQLGEDYEITNFERKTPLNTREPLWRLQDLKPGDCIVVFSRKNALEMKNNIEGYDKKCSVIYGNLSPDVRRQEANKFKTGENPILVATDAIGMGLNLPIQRLFFSAMEKFDGIETRNLTISEIKQIAGRAGRYGFSKSGEVGILFDKSREHKNLLEKAIHLGYEKATDTRIPIAPNLEQIKTICSILKKEDLYSALLFFKEKLIRHHEYYKTANLENMIEIASLLRSKNLDINTMFTYSCVPIDLNSDYNLKKFYNWVNNHIKDIPNLAPPLPEVLFLQTTDSYSLYEAENYVKLCMCYRWLYYKYPEIYIESEISHENSYKANHYIEQSLNKNIIVKKIKNDKFKKRF